MLKYKGWRWLHMLEAQIQSSDRRIPQFATTLYHQFGYLWADSLLVFQERAQRLVTLASIDHRVSEGNPLAHWDPSEDVVYRVCVDPLSRRVEVLCLGIDSVDATGEGIYRDTTALPDWMQEKLAVLSLMSAKPPTTPIEGVGQRIDQNTFWLVRH